MNHTLVKIDKNTWFTKDNKYAIIRAFGWYKKFWIGKVTLYPDKPLDWTVKRCIDPTFCSWKDARSYIIHSIYKK